ARPGVNPCQTARPNKRLQAEIVRTVEWPAALLAGASAGSLAAEAHQMATPQFFDDRRDNRSACRGIRSGSQRLPCKPGTAFEIHPRIEPVLIEVVGSFQFN